MPDQAANFAFQTRRAWETASHAEENAVRRAEHNGARRIEPAAIDHYRTEPGDIPASLYEWPDGSRYIVWDDGTGIQACRPQGRQAGEPRSHQTPACGQAMAHVRQFLREHARPSILAELSQAMRDAGADQKWIALIDGVESEMLGIFATPDDDLGPDPLGDWHGRNE